MTGSSAAVCDADNWHMRSGYPTIELLPGEEVVRSSKAAGHVERGNMQADAS